MNLAQKKYTGINFTIRTESGKSIWYWQDKVGSMCGTDRTWRYEVQQGDVVDRDAGTCPTGEKWSEMNISVLGVPEKIENGIPTN